VTGETLIVPCYNEAARLDGAALIELVDARPSLRLLFVDDGSTDETLRRLEFIAAERAARMSVLGLPRNAGKAEAVRQGLLAALRGSHAAHAARATIVGYFDADLATPVPELLRLLRIMDERNAAVVIAARVALLGNDIHRSVSRHYLGRVFASIASMLLRARVYDTQCGAKLFRAGPELAAALSTPFLSRWAFDVELLGRLLVGGPDAAAVPVDAFLEVPLGAWRDVAGSKLRPAAMVGTLKDLARIGVDLERRRRLVASAR
jgi:glycosyltransferase involved in cell wall biosynthesis